MILYTEKIIDSIPCFLTSAGRQKEQNNVIRVFASLSLYTLFKK